MPNGGLSKDIKTKLQTIACITSKAFLRNKKRSGTNFHTSFSASLLKKNISLVILLTDQISLSGCLYYVRYKTICVL